MAASGEEVKLDGNFPHPNITASGEEVKLDGNFPHP